MQNQLSKMPTFPPAQSVYPRIDLEKALRRFSMLKEKAGKQTEFDRNSLVRSLNFTSANGAATTVIAALVQFGWIQKQDTGYTYTDLGSRLLETTPEDSHYSELLQESLRAPELYRWIFDTYDADLPDEITDTLIGRYQDRHVNKENAGTIVSNYKKSLSYLKDSTRSTPVAASGLNEYIPVSFKEHTVPVLKKYLLEAIQKTHEDEIAQINASLS